MRHPSPLGGRLTTVPLELSAQQELGLARSKRRAGVALSALALLVGCLDTTTPDEDTCLPDPETAGCADMTGDAVLDSLIPYPDSLNPATGLPWDSIP
jgi:hypothetical protein